MNQLDCYNFNSILEMCSPDPLSYTTTPYILDSLSLFPLAPLSVCSPDTHMLCKNIVLREKLYVWFCSQ